MDKEIWRNCRISLEDLQKRKQEELTTGQEESLIRLTIVIQTAEATGKLPSRFIKKITNGLVIGQHLEEPELFILQQTIATAKRRR